MTRGHVRRQKQHTLLSSQFWRLDVRDECVGWAAFSTGVSPWLVDGCLLSLGHMDSPQCCMCPPHLFRELQSYCTRSHSVNSNFTPSLKTLILKQSCSEASQVTKSWNLGDTTHPDIHCPQVEMRGQGWDCWWKDMHMYNLTGADRFQMEKAVAGTVPTAVSQGGCCLAPSLARGFLSLV